MCDGSDGGGWGGGGFEFFPVPGGPRGDFDPRRSLRNALIVIAVFGFFYLLLP